MFFLYNNFIVCDINFSVFVFFCRRKFLKKFRDLIKIRYDVKICYRIVNFIKCVYYFLKEELVFVMDGDLFFIFFEGGI